MWFKMLYLHFAVVWVGKFVRLLFTDIQFEIIESILWNLSYFVKTYKFFIMPQKCFMFDKILKPSYQVYLIFLLNIDIRVCDTDLTMLYFSNFKELRHFQGKTIFGVHTVGNSHFYFSN